MKQSEREAWHEYYVKISQYERWRDFRGISSSCVSGMKRRVRGITDVDDKTALQQVIRAAEKLNVLVHEYAGRYCAMKPEKPLGRPYGVDI